MKVYPVPGLPLRDPVKGDFVPEEGREVEDSQYWRRRLACGDASRTPYVSVAAVQDGGSGLIDLAREAFQAVSEDAPQDGTQPDANESGGDAE